MWVLVIFCLEGVTYLTKDKGQSICLHILRVGLLGIFTLLSLMWVCSVRPDDPDSMNISQMVLWPLHIPNPPQRLLLLRYGLRIPQKNNVSQP